MWIAAAYGVAIAASIAAGYAVRRLHPLAVVAIADVVGTLVVFLFSRAFNNSSFYDPYWSVAPMVMVCYWMVDAGDAVRAVLIAVLVWAWGARLTYNFLKGWPDVRHEDWRYVNIRRRNERAYWLVSFFGIHFAPTAWVFLGCLAFYPAFTSARPFGAIDALAVGFTTGAILLEGIADLQLWQFRRTNQDPGAIMKSGLWRWSRHPNYLGEILFWWGLFLIGAAASPSVWWTVAGPLGITLLFVFISIPMIDKRHCEHRPLYAEHMRTTPALLPRRRARVE